MDDYEVKLMCSYGGVIRYREPDNKIFYVDGHTKIVYVNPNINLSALLDKLMKICNERINEIRYQFPGEDDNTLITVHEKDDLESMMREYDKLDNDSNTTPIMRLFLSLY